MFPNLPVPPNLGNGGAVENLIPVYCSAQERIMLVKLVVHSENWQVNIFTSDMNKGLFFHSNGKASKPSEVDSYYMCYS